VTFTALSNPITLTGTNTYTGATTIGAGNLQIGNGMADGSISASSSITNNGTLIYNLVGAQSYTNVISGTGALVKTGAGSLALSGANTYTGATTVSNGTLRVDGSLASGSYVTVAASGTLGGAGNVAGPVWNYGTLAPGGNAVGPLATGPVYLYGGSALTFKVASADTNNAAGRDFVAMNGTLYLDWLTNGNATIKLVSMQNSNTPGSVSDFNGASNYTWTVGTATSLSMGTNSGALNRLALDTSAFSNPHGGTFALQFDVANNALKVKYTGAATVNTTPAPLGCTVAGNTLHLSWPADHQGWHLQYQTNSLTTGLGTNWITVPGSDTITSTNIAVDPSKPSVFYRLVYP
jgi:autotransporter-associated beta strand protein